MAFYVTKGGPLNSIGQVLRHARERVGLTQEAAAAALGVNRVLLNYYETGRRQVPFATAVALARLYGTTLESLVAGEQESSGPPVSEVLFRLSPATLSDAAQGGLRLFERRVQDYVELARDLGAPLPGPGRSPIPRPHLWKNAGSRWAAHAARQFLGLGSSAVGDLFRLLDEHLLIWRLPLGEDLERAPSGFFYNHVEAGFCIVVNAEMTLGRQVFTLAHELAHAWFHSSDLEAVVSMPGQDRTRERFADAFAGEFLVPAAELKRVAAEFGLRRQPFDPARVVLVQRHFGVSFAMIRVRLRQERLISPTIDETLRTISPSRLAVDLGLSVDLADLGDFKLDPLTAVPTQFLLLVRDGLRNGILTRGDAAEILGTSTEDVRRLVATHPADQAERRVQADLDAAMGLGSPA
jgi:Zn-dependent peptidase ImmA (M78 family)/transcriptional regulator with XRE-family HTH domain